MGLDILVFEFRDKVFYNWIFFFLFENKGENFVKFLGKLYCILFIFRNVVCFVILYKYFLICDKN